VRTGLWMAIIVAATTFAAAAQDKDSLTPMSLDAGFGHMDISTPTIAPEEIIRQFAAKETEFQKALNHYTLNRIMMSPSDLQDIQHGYPFVLTAEDIGQYDVKYVGRQKVDEVDCYVFDVSPKLIEKKKRYLLGRIWVDSTELQIVVTNGRIVPDDTRKGSEDLHPPFMTWRQQIDGHYWFPVYTKGEAVLHFSGGHGYLAEDVHIRDIIKYTDYKQFGSTTKIIYDGQDITAPEKAPDPQQQPKK